MIDWGSKRKFDDFDLISSAELEMEDVHSPSEHMPLRNLLTLVETGKMTLNYRGGIDQLRKDVEREEKGQL